MKNSLWLFQQYYNGYKGITSSTIYSKYINGSHNKVTFIFPIVLMTFGFGVNIYFVESNSLYYFGNTIVFFVFTVVFACKVEKIIHQNFFKEHIEYSYIFSNNCFDFSRKNLRFLHFYYHFVSKLTLNEIEGLIEKAGAAMETSIKSCINFIFMNMIVVFLGVAASMFGLADLDKTISLTILFLVFLYITRFTFLSWFETKGCRLAEFKEFLVYSKYLKKHEERNNYE